MMIWPGFQQQPGDYAVIAAPAQQGDEQSGGDGEYLREDCALETQT